ncbi:MAG: hypothetical protein KO463_02020 [Candidatus Methanofastidiosa archaeon]|nr:hypothetical protein [Candidatus Methanofastidiosa archaeon]
MENTKKNIEHVPPRLEWAEDVEYYPVYINRAVYQRLKGLDQSKIADYCIERIVHEVDNAMLSIDRMELLEQIQDMFEAMNDKELPCASFLLLVRVNRLVE